ncbi:hypothetical protein BG262_09625 [Floricoccus penangensis]|uniref:Uncharacterized protein n=1 Tax=Floricoccus penangensis TaxID=1859475 RepID=A0A9Q5JI33_9LACT|nr:hypothetical protein BG262_09625 [Floricoccus penangensis]
MIELTFIEMNQRCINLFLSDYRIKSMEKMLKYWTEINVAPLKLWIYKKTCGIVINPHDFLKKITTTLK